MPSIINGIASHRWPGRSKCVPLTFLQRSKCVHPDLSSISALWQKTSNIDLEKYGQDRHLIGGLGHSRSHNRCHLCIRRLTFVTGSDRNRTVFLLSSLEPVGGRDESLHFGILLERHVNEICFLVGKCLHVLHVPLEHFLFIRCQP